MFLYAKVVFLVSRAIWVVILPVTQGAMTVSYATELVRVVTTVCYVIPGAIQPATQDAMTVKPATECVRVVMTAKVVTQPAKADNHA